VTLQIDRPLIYLITKGEAVDDDLEKKSGEVLDIIRLAVELEIPLVQIREKRLSARVLYELTYQAVSLTSGSRTRLLVNDRADVALAAGADGVHLTSRSLPAEVIRGTFPSDLLLGVSAHTAEDVTAAALAGADFAVFGPVFETPGKGRAVGLVELSSVCSQTVGFPVIGLGGVDGSNYESVLASGAAGFAAIRWLNDPAELSSLALKINQ